MRPFAKESNTAENFSDQLAQWVEQRGLPRADKNLVTFMTVRDDGKVAIDAGYAVKMRQALPEPES